MEKGGGPPPYTAATPEISAPPYPGPLLDSGAAPWPVLQQYQQPFDQQYPHPVPQQYPQPVPQQYPQPGAQQYQQPALQPNIQLVVQKNQAPQPANHLVVQAKPTEAPGSMMCPHCKITVVSTTEYKVGMLTWAIVGGLCLFMIWPCCLIPFCVSACKDVQHSCPQCNNVLHVYRRM